MLSFWSLTFSSMLTYYLFMSGGNQHNERSHESHQQYELHSVEFDNSHFGSDCSIDQPPHQVDYHTNDLHVFPWSMKWWYSMMQEGQTISDSRPSSGKVATFQIQINARFFSRFSIWCCAAGRLFRRTLHLIARYRCVKSATISLNICKQFNDAHLKKSLEIPSKYSLHKLGLLHCKSIIH